MKLTEIILQHNEGMEIILQHNEGLQAILIISYCQTCNICSVDIHFEQEWLTINNLF